MTKNEHNFSKKGPERLKFSKNVNNKNCAPKTIFFNEKKIERRFG